MQLQEFFSIQKLEMLCDAAVLSCILFWLYRWTIKGRILVDDDWLTFKKPGEHYTKDDEHIHFAQESANARVQMRRTFFVLIGLTLIVLLCLRWIHL